jgi:hypothetical protein
MYHAVFGADGRGEEVRVRFESSATHQLDYQCDLESHIEATEVETHNHCNDNFDFINKSSHAACCVCADLRVMQVFRVM